MLAVVLAFLYRIYSHCCCLLWAPTNSQCAWLEDLFHPALPMRVASTYHVSSNRHYSFIQLHILKHWTAQNTTHSDLFLNSQSKLKILLNNMLIFSEFKYVNKSFNNIFLSLICTQEFNQIPKTINIHTYAEASICMYYKWSHFALP